MASVYGGALPQGPPQPIPVRRRHDQMDIRSNARQVQEIDDRKRAC
jgi:hypothetical protein